MKSQTQRFEPRDGAVAAQQSTHPANDPGKRPATAPGQGDRHGKPATPHEAAPRDKDKPSKSGGAEPSSR
jgi:hypothetical protein